ncbi:MAG: M48 family metalloprotease [Armatimonadetes bacterium]|nr:M48 family metalloprotease [Armatimonadota bacterium]
MNNRRTTITHSIRTMTAFAAALAITGCGTNLLSKNDEIKLGRQAAQGIEQKYGVSNNPADNNLVQRIGQKIMAANNLEWPFTFKVLNDRSVNAVSLPGGPVYVFRGLIDATAGNVDELASVMAHEVAHVQHRHAAKQYSQAVLTDVAIQVGTGGAVQTAAQIANLFAQMSFSREDEYQADSSGIKYAYKAGYDPNGLVEFFRRLQRMEKQGSGNVISNNLRTHPLTSSRIERAEKEIAKITQTVNAERKALEMIDDK